MTKSDGLTTNQRKALPCLLESSNIEKGCKAAGIRTNTFYTWLKDPAFKEEYDRLHMRLFETAVEKLNRNASFAVDTLVSLLGEKVPPSIRRAAANDILNHSSKFRQLESLEQRVEKLEQFIEGGKK